MKRWPMVLPPGLPLQWAITIDSTPCLTGEAIHTTHLEQAQGRLAAAERAVERERSVKAEDTAVVPDERNDAAVLDAAATGPLRKGDMVHEVGERADSTPIITIYGRITSILLPRGGA